MLSIWTLIEQGGKKTFTMRSMSDNAIEAERQAVAERSPSVRQGFAGTFDRLAAFLATPWAGHSGFSWA